MSTQKAFELCRRAIESMHGKCGGASFAHIQCSVSLWMAATILHLLAERVRLDVASANEDGSNLSIIYVLSGEFNAETLR